MKKLFKLFSLIIFAVAIFTPSFVLAQDTKKDIRNFELNIPIPDLKLSPITVSTEKNDQGEDVQVAIIPWISEYVGGIYKYMIVIGSIFAVLFFMIGGIYYLWGSFSPAKVSEAKQMMLQAIWGISLLLGSYLILNLLNPNLVNLNAIKVENVKMQSVLPQYCEDIVSQFSDKVEVLNMAGKTCGQEAEIKVKSGVDFITSQKTCVVNSCANPKEGCMSGKDMVTFLNKRPATPAIVNLRNTFSGMKYFCWPMAVQGAIITAKSSSDAATSMALSAIGAGTAYDEGYLDYIYLYENAVSSFTSFNIYDDAIGFSLYAPGQKNYSIFRAEKSDLAADNYYLQIEVNDPGLMATNDDKYQIDKSGNPIGIKGSACCTYKCTGEGKFIIEPNCNWITRYDLTHDTIKVDINTNKVFCGTVPLQEAKDEVSGMDYEVNECYLALTGLPVGAACGDDPDCASGDCVSKNLNGQAIKKCECNDNQDCKTGEMCLTSLATWNICVSGKAMVGEYCTSSDQCTSGNCQISAMKCQCNSETDCPAGQVCKPNPYPQANTCVIAKKIGETCADNWECISDDCEDDQWYDVSSYAGKHCECNSDKQCASGEKCVEVENSCGWNYCVSKATLVPSIEYYDDSPEVLSTGKGLCDANSDCASDDCVTNWGFNNCNACKE